MEKPAHYLEASILVVDDERCYTDELAGLLGPLCRVAVAHSGEQALGRAASDPSPNLILLDWRMPGMSGLEVCRELKRTPRTALIPIIFLTDDQDWESENLGFAAGGVDYLRKPLSPAVVTANLHNYLALINQRQGLEQLVEARTQQIADLHEEALQHAKELDRRVAQRTEQLELVNKELESFCYSVSHDLRAPLRAINGFSRALLDQAQDQLDAQSVEYIQRILTSGRRMEELIQDLLELSRVTRSHFNTTAVDLSALVASVAERIAQDYQETRVELEIQANMLALGDARLLRIVVENLLSNAYKFTAHSPQPRVRFGCREERGDQVYFIQDNGAGFDEHYADKLFVPFQRLHHPSDYPGTGIGLATVQRVIRRHGGKIWGRSTGDQGAEFCFTLAPGRF